MRGGTPMIPASSSVPASSAAGYTSAIVLAMIALIIGYQATTRLFAPVTIRFDEAIVIAAGSLIVNVATAWLLSGGGDYHP